MCNACGYLCCGLDTFDGCGCDCPEVDCRLEHCGFCGVQYDPTIGDDCHCYDDDGYDDDWEDDQ